MGNDQSKGVGKPVESKDQDKTKSMEKTQSMDKSI